MKWGRLRPTFKVNATMRKRRKFSPEFKRTVALEALQEQELTPAYGAGRLFRSGRIE